MENQQPNQSQRQFQNQAQGQSQNQQYYGNPQQNRGYAPNYAAQKNTSVVSTGEWIIAIIITAIPFVGIIVLLIWAFSGNSVPESKANWAKASLIFYLITVILVICFYGAIFAFSAGIAALAAPYL